MRNFKTKIEGHEEEFDFECYENTEPIKIGDKYIFFFGGIADVQVCDSEAEKAEINKNDRVKDYTKIDFVTELDGKPSHTPCYMRCEFKAENLIRRTEPFCFIFCEWEIKI